MWLAAGMTRSRSGETTSPTMRPRLRFFTRICDRSVAPDRTRAETDSENPLIRDRFARLFLDAAGSGMWSMFGSPTVSAELADVEPNLSARMKNRVDFMARADGVLRRVLYKRCRCRYSAGSDSGVGSRRACVAADTTRHGLVRLLPGGPRR
jgi:hypothetical protein